jgi:CheY-like chemotaxis protein
MCAFEAAPGDYDVVLTDEVMPGTRGTELARCVTCIRQDIPVILLSGFTENIDEHAARSAGVDEILVKPVTPLELAEAIQRVRPSAAHNV